MLRGDSASPRAALRSRRPQSTPRYFLHENWETSGTSQPVGTGGRRLRPYDPPARFRGVGQRHSTHEPFEQGQKNVGGEGGGKAADQGEHPSAPHAPDTVREKRAPGVDGCAVNRAAFRRHLSAIRAVCANQRPHGSERGQRATAVPTATRKSNRAKLLILRATESNSDRLIGRILPMLGLQAWQQIPVPRRIRPNPDEALPPPGKVATRGWGRKH